MIGWPKSKLGQVRAVSNSYQSHSSSQWEVIYGNNCPNSNEKLTKIEIRSGWSQFDWPIGSHNWSLFAPIHMKIKTKVNFGKVEVCSNIAQIHYSGL